MTTRIRCELNDYYKDGLSLSGLLGVLEAIYHGHKQPSLREIKKWELPYFKKNLWVLGFLEGVPSSTSYGISPRGLSFICGRILAKQGLISHENVEDMARFVLLKAIADIDWKCFLTLLIEHYLKKRRPKEIKEKFFPYDKGSNFYHRWGFHKKILEQISLPIVIKKLHFSPDNYVIDYIDPYSTIFRADIFFNKELQKVSEKNLKAIINASLEVYFQVFRSHYPIAYSEVLKTIIQLLLLNNDMFLSEPALCKIAIPYLLEIGVSFGRSSKGIPLMGRGFYIWERKTKIFYSFFRISENYK